jgi:hypothetical protein
METEISAFEWTAGVADKSGDLWMSTAMMISVLQEFAVASAEKRIPACGRQASPRPPPAKPRRERKSAGLRSLRGVTQGRRDDTQFTFSTN